MRWIYTHGSLENTNFWVGNWNDLVRIFQESYGPPEFQNPDAFLCSIKQGVTVAEYRFEFAKRAARVTDWSENALLSAFIAGDRRKS